jgi:hypothetical protein
VTNTERKLDEAKYFLGQLNTDDPYFDYILSAYLNAARSTTWIMKYEFDKVSNWISWYESKEISNDQRALLKQINDLRVAATKKDGVKTGYYFFDSLLIPEENYSEIKKFQKLEGEWLITIKTKEEAENEKSLAATDSEEAFTFTGKTGGEGLETKTMREELHQLCKSYFNFLDNLVHECVSIYVGQLNNSK